MSPFVYSPATAHTSYNNGNILPLFKDGCLTICMESERQQALAQVERRDSETKSARFQNIFKLSLHMIGL